MKHVIRTVLFDYDGTLIDSAPAMYEGICRVFRAGAVTPPGFEEFCRTFSSPWMKWYEDRGVRLSPEEVHAAYYTGISTDDAPYFEHSKRTVSELRARGIKIGIVSAHYPEKIYERLVEKDGVLHPHEPIVGRAVAKAEAIRHVCQELQVPVEEALYVGDIASDMSDGVEAGVLTAAHIGPRGHRSAFVDPVPTFYLTCLSDLLEHVAPVVRQVDKETVQVAAKGRRRSVTNTTIEGHPFTFALEPEEPNTYWLDPYTKVEIDGEKMRLSTEEMGEVASITIEGSEKIRKMSAFLWEKTK